MASIDHIQRNMICQGNRKKFKPKYIEYFEYCSKTFAASGGVFEIIRFVNSGVCVCVCIYIYIF